MRSMFLLAALPFAFDGAAAQAMQPRRPMGPPPMRVSGGAQMPERRPEQDIARDRTRAGMLRPLREIEDRVVPRMTGADYLGPELDAGSGTYRLKFMRGGSVIWIDVDGRTGAIISRRGN